MKILHTADWHLGKKLYQIDRLPEQKLVLEEICAIADKEQVDAVLVAGDIFDTINPGAEVTEVLYKYLKRLSNDGHRPVIAIAGNHDSPDRIAAPDPLARECGILLIGYPHTEVVPFNVNGHWKVSKSDKGFIEIEWPDGNRLRLITTAFTNELRTRQFLGAEEDYGIREYLEQHWSHIAGAYCDDQGVNILMAHLLVWNRNAAPPEEPEGEKPIQIGTASIVYSDLIPGNIQYAALGHLHRAQQVAGSSKPAWYCGSPLCYSFSEAGQIKYIHIIEAFPGQEVALRQVALQAGTPLLRKTFSRMEEIEEWIAANNHAHIEARIKTRVLLSAKDVKRMQDLTSNLLHIIPEVFPTEQEAGEAMTEDIDDNIHSLFKKYFRQETGTDPNEELIHLFNEILK